MKEKLLKVLYENLDLLEKSQLTLKKSVEKCQKIGIKNDYTFEELESFDSLTSKFARTSDIYTQKVLRSVFNLLREPQLTIIDLANRAEKLQMISSADELLEMRDLRNDITHEYIQEVIIDLFETTLILSEKLFENIELTKKFAQKLTENKK